MKVLNYATPTTDPPDSRLVRLRWLFLALYLIGMGAWYWAAFGGSRDVNIDRDLLPLLGITAIFFSGQVLLLVGAPHWRWPRPRRRGAVWVSIVAGSLIAALLSAGILLSLMSLLEIVGVIGKDAHDSLGGFLFFAAIGVPWLFWLVLFGFVWVGEWLTLFRRMYRFLVAGTFLELAITIPIDVQVRKRTSCYCGEGTFFALIVGLTAIFWTFGPGIVLLFLTRRMQRRREFEDGGEG